MKLKHRLLSTLMLGSFAIIGTASAAGDDPSAEAHKERGEMKRQHRSEMRELRSEHRAQSMLLKVDANKDGQIDLNEYLAHAQERFNKIDLDENGFVTPDEAKASMKKMKKEHKEKRKELREKRKQSEG